MLACNEPLTEKHYRALDYSDLWVSDKLDGLRCRLHLNPNPEDTDRSIIAYSRSNTALPNMHIQSALGKSACGFDGEIVIPGLSFHEIQSKVMKEVTLPFGFRYMCFDWIEPGKPFLQRYNHMRAKYNRYAVDEMLVLPIRQVKTYTQLMDQFAEAVDRGNEGLIIRSGSGPYKLGRSTYREGYMLKMKQMEDAEAVIIGFKEAMANDNEAILDVLGKSKRSSHQANMRGKNVLGAFICIHPDTGLEFSVGGGMTDAQRKEFWKNQRALRGKTLCYQFHAHGVKDRPRQPVFKGIRND